MRTLLKDHDSNILRSQNIRDEFTIKILHFNYLEKRINLNKKISQRLIVNLGFPSYLEGIVPYDVYIYNVCIIRNNSLAEVRKLVRNHFALRTSFPTFSRELKAMRH